MNDARRKDSGRFLRLAPLLLLLVVAGGYGLWYLLSRGEPTPDPAETAEAGDGLSDPIQPEDAPELLIPDPGWTELLGTPPAWPFDQTPDCRRSVEELQRICRRIDSRLAEQSRAVPPQGTFAMLTGLAADLEARPPEVEGLMQNVDRLRGNVAHLFRVLGGERLYETRDLIRDNPEFLEPLTLALYDWTRSGDSCEGNLPAPPNFSSQYTYSAFLIDTLGGQALLRRRPPIQEALAGFMALQVVENAIDTERDPLAVNPMREIRRCRRLIEGQDLVFRGRYLEALDRMEERLGPRFLE
ncbi:hypothetical protein ABI59_00680 [Acidobacteria bacterium Mor1]|nr:hypothetical protein ABI59_00680 [Acidobacteria bacterium Mor1]